MTTQLYTDLKEAYNFEPPLATGEMSIPNTHLSEEEISNRLREKPKQDDEELSHPRLTTEPARPAAVLVPLLRFDREWHILFTRRTETLPEHSGQVAFPGGRCDPSDKNSEETALREAYEEIRIHPQDVKILGRLRTRLTTSNYLVTPIVGVIPQPYKFSLANEEVSRVFTIPLAWLADPTNREVRPRIISPRLKPLPVIYFKPYGGEVLWGVSAQIVVDLLKALKLSE